MMKMNTAEKGLSSLFRPYKAALLCHLWDVTEPDFHEGAKSSGYLHSWVNANAEELGFNKVSRATVINSLNDFVDEGILKWKDATGKGGHRRLYSVAMSPEKFKAIVTAEFVGKLDEIFEADWWRLGK